jgi:hypothetical protein
VAATNLGKYRQLQAQMDEAEERADLAENSLSKVTKSSIFFFISYICSCEQRIVPQHRLLLHQVFNMIFSLEILYKITVGLATSASAAVLRSTSFARNSFADY